MELLSGGSFWSSRQQRCSLLPAALLFLLFRLTYSDVDIHTSSAITVSGLNRKLLKHAVLQQVEPEPEPEAERVEKCGKSDIVINQGATGPLPNGIPSYTVEIMNQCVSGCNISTLHLSCGWFSSATAVNPLLFKRLAYNDCLVNDGRPLPCGAALSFQYASTFSYPLSVASLAC